jgi:hypothetical protein
LPGTRNADDPTTTPWTQYIGYQGDGSTDYISTNYNPSADSTLITNTGGFGRNDGSIGVYLWDEQQDGSAQFVFSANDATNYIYFTPRNASNEYAARLNVLAATSMGGANLVSIGMHILSRTTPKIVTYYLNGVSVEAESNEESSAIPNAEIELLRYNGTYFSDHQVGIYFIMSKVVDATEAAALTLIFDTYLNALP